MAVSTAHLYYNTTGVTYVHYSYPMNEQYITRSIPLKKFKANDRVNTPNGSGNIWCIEDEIFCVQLDKEPDILYEFYESEIKKIE